MEFLDLLLSRWPAMAGIASLLSAVAVLWLTANFPRRREFEALETRIAAQEAREARLDARMEKLEQAMERLDARMDAMERTVAKSAAQTESLHVLIEAANEKNHWRMGALENQVTILLRGHLGWEEK